MGVFKEHFVKIIIVDILTPTKLDFMLNPKILALTRVGGIQSVGSNILKNGPTACGEIFKREGGI